MKKTRLKDVAEAAGISVAAVSMILAGKGKISPTMNDRVRTLATEMGYVGKSPDKNSTKRNSKYVAILQREDYSYSWNFSIPMTLLLEEQLVRMGKTPIVFHVPAKYTAKGFFKEIIGARIGALFTMHYVEPELFTELERVGIPVIIINNSEYQNEFCSVISDNLQASYEATNHLCNLGHQVIGYADYERAFHPFLVADRFYGYRRAIEEKGLPFQSCNVINSHTSDFASLVEQVGRIQATATPPTAWVTHDDFFAAFLIEALRANGLRVPLDVSIIAAGGDVLDYSLPFLPQITTMQVDAKLMISMAWNLLDTRLKSPSDSVQVLKTKMNLVDRGSTLKMGY